MMHTRTVDSACRKSHGTEGPVVFLHRFHRPSSKIDDKFLISSDLRRVYGLHSRVDEGCNCRVSLSGSALGFTDKPLPLLPRGGSRTRAVLCEQAVSFSRLQRAWNKERSRKDCMSVLSPYLTKAQDAAYSSLRRKKNPSLSGDSVFTPHARANNCDKRSHISSVLPNSHWVHAVFQYVTLSGTYGTRTRPLRGRQGPKQEKGFG